MYLLEFHSTFTIRFAVLLKRSSFWPSADVKHKESDLVHARCNALALHVCSFYVSIIEIGLEHAPFVVLVYYFFPQLITQKAC
jgi:hypothetical protein